MLQQPFITEKTFKPIVHSHPFILIAGKGAIKQLKKIGFKFYDELAGKGYATSEKQVQNIIKELSEKSLDDLKEILPSLKNKVKHNFNIFMYTEVIWDDWVGELYEVITSKRNSNE